MNDFGSESGNDFDDEGAQSIFEASAEEDPAARGIAALDAAAPALAAALRRAVPFLIRRGVAVAADPAAGGALSAIEAELLSPHHIVPLKTEPSGVPGAIILDSIAIAFLLDGALGGDGSSPPTLAPEGLTGPQRALIGRLMGAVPPALSAVLEASLGMRIKKPAAGDEGPAPEDVIALRLRLGEGGGGGSAVLVIGREALVSAAGTSRRPTGLDPILAAAIGAVEIEIVVELGRVRLSLQEVASLRVGHVLDLATPVGGAVPVRIDGRLMFRGHPITSGSHVAVKIAGGVRLDSRVGPAT